MDTKYIISAYFILNYFSIFYLCYVDQDFKTISEYPGFFTQYFLLLVSLSLYIIQLYKPTTILPYRTALQKLKLNPKVYFTYQISFLIYTLISSFAIPQYIFLVNYSYTNLISYKPYITYLCSTGILCIVKIKVLSTKEETTPYFIA